MKTLTVRLPEDLARRIEQEARVRRVSKSDIVRECLDQPQRAKNGSPAAGMQELIGDLIGSVHHDGRPADLSSNKKNIFPP
jgi:Arc/MetJ-type ribon-helix-helix transcriptional regulator